MKLLVIFLIGSIIGFFLHALVFPEVFSNGIFSTPDLITETTVLQSNTSTIPPLITKVTFDGKFSKHNITVEQSRYLAIINTNAEQLMWLISNDTDFITSRGYGYMEQVKKRMDEKGRIIVSDKHNPEEKLIITVK